MVRQKITKSSVRSASGMLVALVFCTFFAASAFSGENAVSQSQALEARTGRLESLLAQVREERQILEARVEDMSAARLDPDRLEEEVRRTLGYVHPDEIIIVISD